MTIYHKSTHGYGVKQLGKWIVTFKTTKSQKTDDNVFRRDLYT